MIHVGFCWFLPCFGMGSFLFHESTIVNDVIRYSVIYYTDQHSVMWLSSVLDAVFSYSTEFNCQNVYSFIMFYCLLNNIISHDERDSFVLLIKLKIIKKTFNMFRYLTSEKSLAIAFICISVSLIFSTVTWSEYNHYIDQFGRIFFHWVKWYSRKLLSIAPYP